MASADLHAFLSTMAKAWGGALESDERDRPTLRLSTAPTSYDSAALNAAFERYQHIARHLVVTQHTLTAASPSFGHVVELPFDASARAETEVVAYELLLKEGEVIAAHTDLDADEQTVAISSSQIATCATDAADGDHLAQPEPATTIVDTVSYARLIPGKEYRLRGVLVDKNTGKELTANGAVIENELRFTPNEPTGTIALSFTFDASELNGTYAVAFEDLFKDDELVASHRDLADEAQTVFITDTPIATGKLPRTGDPAKAAIIAAALLAAASLALANRTIRRRKQR